MNFEGPQPHSPPLKTKLKRRYEVDNETKIKSNRLERQTHLKSFLCRVAPRWVGGWEEEETRREETVDAPLPTLPTPTK